MSETHDEQGAAAPETVPQPPSETTSESTDEAASKRRRRWPWILLGVVVVGLSVVAFVGPLIIQSVAKGQLEAAAEENGYALEVGQCSFGWSDGLSVRDLVAKPVGAASGLSVRVNAVDAVPRWSGMVRGRVSLERVVIDRPVIVLDPSRPMAPPVAAAPPEPVAGAKAQPRQTLAEQLDALRDLLGSIDARLMILDGSVQVKGTDGGPGLSLTEFRVDATLVGGERTLTARAGGSMVGGGRTAPLRLDASFGFRDALTGNLTASLGAIDLKALRPWLRFGDANVTDGIVKLDGAVTAADGRFTVKGAVEADDVRVAGPDGVEPFQAPALVASIDAVADPAAQRVDVKAFTVRGAPLGVDIEGAVGLADTSFDGTIKSRGDLAKVTPFLGDLAKDGLRLAGALTSEFRVDAKLAGEALAASVKGGARVQGLRVASRAVEKPFEADDAALDCTATYRDGKIAIETMTLRGAPLEVDVAGKGEVGERTLFDGEATLRGNLADLTPFLGGRADLKGALDGRVGFETSGESTSMVANLAVRDLRVKSAAVERPFETPRASLVANASITGQSFRLDRCEVRGAPLDVDVRGTGATAPTMAFDGRVTLKGDLTRVTPFLDGAAALGGALDGGATITVRGGTSSIDGAFAVDGLAVTADALREPLRAKRATIAIVGTAERGENETVVKLSRFEASGLPLHVKGAVAGTLPADPARPPTFDGLVELTGALANVNAFVPRDLRLAGQLTGVVRLEADTNAPGTKVTGDLQVRDFRAKKGTKPPIESKALRLVANARVERADRIRLEKTTVRGAPLDVDVAGVITLADAPRFKGTMGLRGDLTRVNPLVAAYSESDLELAGGLTSTFTVTASAKTIALAGTAGLKQLRVARPVKPDAGSRAGLPTAQTKALLLNEPDATVVTDLEMTLGERLTGVVKADGKTLGMNVELDSESWPKDAAMPVTRIKGKVNADTARLVEGLGVSLPLGLSAAGKLDSTYEGKLFATAKDVFSGKFSLSGPEVRRPGIDIRGVRLDGTWGGDFLKDATLTARINGGTIALKGQVDLARDGSPFSFKLDAKDVKVTQGIASILRFIVPLYSIPEGVDAEVGGAFSASMELSGPIPTSLELAERLVGRGSVNVGEGYVRGSPVVTQLLQALGKRDRYAFKALNSAFRIANGTVFHDSFRAEDRELAWGFDGRTRFNTVIDYRLKPGPLIDKLYQRRIRKGKMRRRDKVFRDILKSLSSLPVGISGTLDSPRLALQNVQIPGVVKPLEGLLEGLLGGRKKRKG